MFNALGDRPGVATWVFVVFVGVLMPVIVIRQHYAMKDGRMAAPSRAALYGSAFTTHAILVLGIAATVWLDDVWLFPPFGLDRGRVLLALAALAIGLLLLMERFRVANPLARERMRLVAPATRGEYLAFCGIAVSAGIAEQLAYRGVLFSFLLWYTGSHIAAALLAAVPFGLVHLFQGWRTAAIVGVIAVRDQILVVLTGTLVYAIAIHIIHDIIAGTVLMRRARREDI
jgi:membrane protease YdiL (CAAX protease family)